MLCAPFAMVGGVAALHLTGIELSISAAIGFIALLGQRPEGGIQHVVQHAHFRRHHFFKGGEVELGRAVDAEGVLDEARQDDGAQIAAAVGRQGLLATGIGGIDGFAIRQVVVGIDVVDEQDAGFGEVVGRLHDAVPHGAGLDGLVDPLAVGTLVGALGDQAGTGLGAMHQFPVGVLFDGLHEAAGHAHGHVEVVPAARGALGRDEFLHIGVVDAQHAHLGTTAGTGRLHGGAGLVEHIDVAAGAGSHGGRALHLGTTGADAREVIAHTTAAAHGFGRFAQRFVDAGEAFVVHTLDAIAHGLHEAVDQRGLDVGARGTHDAAGADAAGTQVLQETGFLRGALVFVLDRGQRTGHTAEQVFHAGFTGLEVLFLQHVQADGLFRQTVLCSHVHVFALHCFPHPLGDLQAGGLQPLPIQNNRQILSIMPQVLGSYICESIQGAGAVSGRHVPFLQRSGAACSQRSTRGKQGGMNEKKPCIRPAEGSRGQGLK